MSDFVRPHRWQPTRLPCPWDSSGKNTGVGCHFLLQKSSDINLFYNEVMTIFIKYFQYYWKWEIEGLYGYWMIASVLYLVMAWPTGSCGWLLLLRIRRKYCKAYHQSRQNKNSKSQVWFLPNAYLFHTTIKSNNLKSNHCKSEIICRFHK